MNTIKKLALLGSVLSIGAAYGMDSKVVEEPGQNVDLEALNLRNHVLYGPPGVGKTEWAKSMVAAIGGYNAELCKPLVDTQREAYVRLCELLIEQKADEDKERVTIGLHYADARAVKDLCYRLMNKDLSDNSGVKMFEETEVYVIPSTNSLEVFGSQENIKRLRDLIFKYIDLPERSEPSKEYNLYA